MVGKYLKRVLLTQIYVLIALTPTSISALSDAQLQIFNQGIYYFNVDDDTLGFGLGSAIGSTCYSTALPQINDQAGVAKAIDQFITNNGGIDSPFNGLGPDIVAGAVRAGVNPFLVASQALKESSFGVNIPTGSFNSFGRKAASKQPQVSSSGSNWYKWPSFKDSVNWSGAGDPTSGGGLDEPNYINNEYVSQGLTTIESYVNKYAPASDNNNTVVYIQQLNNFFEEMIASAGNALSCGVPGSGIGGNFVLYSQFDPRWTNVPYGPEGIGDIGSSGCGPSAMAMIVTSLTGQSVPPDIIASAFGSYHLPGAGSKHGLFPAVASAYKLKAEHIGTDLTAAAKALVSGSLVIATGQGTTPFTGGGHILVLRGVTADGQFLLGDSNSKVPPDTDPENSNPMSPRKILTAGLQSLWVISR